MAHPAVLSLEGTRALCWEEPLGLVSMGAGGPARASPRVQGPWGPDGMEAEACLRSFGAEPEGTVKEGLGHPRKCYRHNPYRLLGKPQLPSAEPKPLLGPPPGVPVFLWGD